MRSSCTRLPEAQQRCPLEFEFVRLVAQISGEFKIRLSNSLLLLLVELLDLLIEFIHGLDHLRGAVPNHFRIRLPARFRLFPSRRGRSAEQAQDLLCGRLRA